MAQTNNIRAEEAYVDKLLTGVRPGPTGTDRWTSDYANRDTAVKGGISPTRVVKGNVKLQNVISFYRPVNVPVTSNGFREMRNISVERNLLESLRATFEQEKWQNVSIVVDVTKVTVPTSRQKARGRSAVIDELVALADSWAANAWIASSAFTIEKLQSDPLAVVIRPGGDGFTIDIKKILSGIGNIFDIVDQFDISFAALSQ